MTFSRLQSKRLPMHLTVNTHEGERKQSHIAKEQVSLAIIIMFNISPLSACFSWSHLCVPCSGVRRPSFDAPPTHWLKSINFNTKIIHCLSCNSFSKREARCPQFVLFETETERECALIGYSVTIAGCVSWKKTNIDKRWSLQSQQASNKST